MKSRFKWSEKSIERRIKNGYGQGYQVNYKPWLTIQDVPSIGVVTRVKGILVPRVYHFMSLLEYQYFCMLEWSERVNDIREQFPLFQRADAQLIAENKGITYPTYPKTNVPIIMTSDFAIQLKDTKGKLKEIVRTIKPSNELKNKRVLEKLEIEREYWERREIDWGIVTEQELCPIMIYNLNFFQRAYYYDENFPVFDLVPHLIDGILNNSDRFILELVTKLDKGFNTEVGTYLSIFKFLLSRKIVGIDMKKKIDLQNLSCKEIIIHGGVNFNAFCKNGT